MSAITWNDEPDWRDELAMVASTSDEVEPGIYFEIWLEDDGSFTVDLCDDNTGDFHHIAQDLPSLDVAKQAAEQNERISA